MNCGGASFMQQVTAFVAVVDWPSYDAISASSRTNTDSCDFFPALIHKLANTTSGLAVYCRVYFRQNIHHLKLSPQWPQRHLHCDSFKRRLTAARRTATFVYCTITNMSSMLPSPQDFTSHTTYASSPLSQLYLNRSSLLASGTMASSTNTPRLVYLTSRKSLRSNSEAFQPRGIRLW